MTHQLKIWLFSDQIYEVWWWTLYDKQENTNIFVCKPNFKWKHIIFRSTDTYGYCWINCLAPVYLYVFVFIWKSFYWCQINTFAVLPMLVFPCPHISWYPDIRIYHHLSLSSCPQIFPLWSVWRQSSRLKCHGFRTAALISSNNFCFCSSCFQGRTPHSCFDLK